MEDSMENEYISRKKLIQALDCLKVQTGSLACLACGSGPGIPEEEGET